MATNDWLLKGWGAAYVDPKIALKLSGLTVRYEMINHIKEVEKMQQQQQQQQQQQMAEQSEQAKKDEDVKRLVLTNHAKLDLAKSLNELHAGTLKNRELSDKLTSQNIMNQLFQQSKNGVAA
jgi:rRNA maturation endonuclease Nob1